MGSATAMVIVLVFKSRALVRCTITVLLGVMSSARIIILLYLYGYIPTLIGNRGTSRYRTICVCIPLIHRGDRYNTYNIITRRVVIFLYSYRKPYRVIHKACFFPFSPFFPLIIQHGKSGFWNF